MKLSKERKEPEPQVASIFRLNQLFVLSHSTKERLRKERCLGDVGSAKFGEESHKIKQYPNATNVPLFLFNKKLKLVLIVLTVHFLY